MLDEKTPVSEEIKENNEEPKEAPVVEEENKEVEAPVEEKKEAPAPNNKKGKKDPDECHDFMAATNLDDVCDQIELKRRNLLAIFNKTKMVSRILMTVVVIAVIAAIILIFNDIMALKIVGYSIAGVVLMAMLVYYITTKDKFPKTSKAYISEVTDLINGYDFADERFSDLKVYPNKKLSKTDLEVDRVYKNSSDIGSRNFITGKFDGHNFEVSENVLYSISAEKKNQRTVAFLGKYLSLENNKKFEGRYIFNLKGNPEKLVDQPNDIDDLKVILEEDNLVVYSSNDKEIKDVFGTKFLSKLKEIKCDARLLNFIIVVWAGHTAAYLSYDDSVTVLPFEHEFNREAQDKYREDLIAALELATMKK
ncbi:MAG: hypothetical protein K5906_01600 [Bacilli bacterium]|nr:hypothetical protein [Bacilli bacterium]